ncbi:MULTISPECIES: MATE family efflux transporter [unclassified Leisingera]|uniref:MATE family efflux transporter n=1 Tax=unclassified Leisingera TaxID=2614906 RepID=UPI0002E42C3D|nr:MULTISPECIES: MATE family efflux transporter [unclassified Leisingera]KIC14439.1 multidrug transporter [Leisingera sp. ANG-DT]KIC25560.1 multidrug transporter [Leisingera sp. ANG-S3]KIC54336.1 multidrug transporter [Leisingera sp. ANG-S]KID10843.1 multidrug transporter [Leisingera sp. ANG1]
MTSADTEITHRRVLSIALPIVLSNATVPILGAVDTGVVGQMGEAAPIGAVGIGAVILATIYWIFGFLRMGTTGLAAQARGAGDWGETGALLMRGLLLAFAAGAVFIIAQGAVFWGAFALAPASAEVESLARDYLQIRIWGAPATIALYAVTGWLIAVERTRGVFLLQVWMNGLNIALDLWFVLGLGWGVEGVAIATLIAEWSGLALGLYLCRDAFAGDQWRDWARVFDPARLKRMMQVNGDIMVRSVLLTGSFTTFLFIGSGIGDVNLAANQILLQFVEITAFALDGFAFSAEALVGGAVGAKARQRVRRASIVTSQWGVGGAVLLGIAFAAGGPWLIDLMSTSPEVREAGRVFLIWAAVLPVLSVASYMFDGIYIGATWTRDMRWAMLQSVAIYVAALLLLVPTFGNHGLWAALIVLNLARGVTLGLRYPRLEAQVGV